MTRNIMRLSVIAAFAGAALAGTTTSASASDVSGLAGGGACPAPSHGYQVYVDDHYVAVCYN